MDPNLSHSPKPEAQTVDVIYQMPQSDMGCRIKDAAFQITNPEATAEPVPPKLKIEMLCVSMFPVLFINSMMGSIFSMDLCVWFHANNTLFWLIHFLF